MIFRQLFDSDSSTYTYLLGCTASNEAVLIDAVYERHTRDTALLRELGLKLRYTMDTHVHADHVSASWLLRESEGAEVVLSKRYGAAEVDVAVDDGDRLPFGACCLRALATPGHTNGCLSFVDDDQRRVFSGDCLMIRGAGRTDFQGGDAVEMWHSIRDKLFALPDDFLIYPAHDYAGRTLSTIGEEKRFNPRIGGDARQEDFVGYMDNLGLPHPKRLAIAVPANMQCGRPSDDEMPKRPEWGPVTITFAGVPEVPPTWVAQHLDELCLLDVRSESEFDGEQGHIEGSHLIPLDQLRDRLAELPTAKPVIAICQSGKRSAMATQILKAAGRERVANVEGGLIHWTRLGLPHVAASPDYG